MADILQMAFSNAFSQMKFILITDISLKCVSEHPINGKLTLNVRGPS